MRRLAPWVVILVAVVAWLAASRWFFPLKTAMHFDEAVNYAQPAVAPSPTRPPGLFDPLVQTANGALIRFFAGGLYVLLPVTPDGAFRLYKLLVFALTLGALWFFGRRLAPASPALALWLVVAAVAAPMTWIQANEVMTEPLGLAAALLFLALVIPVVDGGARTRRELLQLAGATLLLLLVKFDVCVLVAGTTIVTLGVRAALSGKKEGRDAIVFLVGALGAGTIAWIVTRSDPGGVFTAMFQRFSILGHDYDSLATGMSGFDKLVFGPRIFFWLYFPALPLVALSVAGWTKSRMRLDSRQRLLLALVAGSGVVFAFAYRSCLQERYFHLPNTLALVAGVWGLFLAVERWGRELRKPATVAGLVVLAGLSVFDYVALLTRLPCFGNMQIYGPYRGDAGGCDEASTLFGLAGRRHFVSFPHLKCRYYFPFGPDGADRAPFDALDAIKASLARGTGYLVLPGSPNYLTPSQLILWHMEKFGEVPAQPMQGAPTLLVSLAFPPESPHNSLIYSELENSSLAQADDLWRRQGERTPLRSRHEERNERYVLRIAAVEAPPAEMSQR